LFSAGLLLAVLLLAGCSLNLERDRPVDTGTVDRALESDGPGGDSAAPDKAPGDAGAEDSNQVDAPAPDVTADQKPTPDLPPPDAPAPDKGPCKKDVDCDDGLTCTKDTCVMGGCQNSPMAGTCLIGKTCHKQGASNPKNACQQCDAKSAQLYWTDLVGKSGCVFTVAGDSAPGAVDGALTKARFNAPRGVAVSAAGVVYVADTGNHKIRAINNNGVVSTLAGTGVKGFKDGAANKAQFNAPVDVAVSSVGDVYVADRFNHRVRVISKGWVSTVAGSKMGMIDGTLASALLAHPSGLAVDSTNKIYIGDTNNNRVRVIHSGTISTFAGGKQGYADGSTTSALFNGPVGVVVGPGGVYVADANNYRVRQISSAKVTTLAGSGVKGFLDGSALSARFDQMFHVALGALGDVYVTGNHSVRRVSSGTVSTVAGNGSAGFADGHASKARFNTPVGLAVDSKGAVYIGDSGNHRIRVLYP